MKTGLKLALSLAVIPLALVVIPACGAKVKKGPEVTEADRTLAKEHFSTYCVTCHGESGKGDGPAGVNLDPKPRNWTDKAWQKSVDDEHIAKVIKEGGASVGLSAQMASNPVYADNPGVIAALVEIVRSYGK